MRNEHQVLIIAGALALATLLPQAAFAAPEAAGNVIACDVDPGSADCTLENGRIRLELYGDDILRIRATPHPMFRDRPTGAIVADARRPHVGRTFDTGNAIVIESSLITARLTKAPVALAIWRSDGSLISIDIENGLAWDRETGLVLTKRVAHPGERYLGLGERGGPVNRRGRRLVMRNTDRAAFDSYTDPLYISIPFYYAFRDGNASGVLVDNAASPFFEFDVEGSGAVAFGVLAGELDYYVMAGPEPALVARAYHQLTGPSQLPPRWTLGYHQSRYSYMSQEEVLQVAWFLRALRIPTDVLYFDIDYLDKLQMFTWNRAAFPDPAAMNNLLASWGFRTVTIQEPIHHIGDPLWPFLAQSSFYLRGPTGLPLVNDIWFGRVSWLDFSKTVVRSWYKGALKAFMGTYGVDGVWNDLNEPAQNHMPEALYDFDGHPRTDLEARNLYALLEGQTTYEALRELRPNVRPWVFSRSGFAGFHRYGVNWGGDADSSFSSLRASVEMSLSMGLSGQPFFGHDIGGFLGSPSPELFLRWMTFSAYTPLFRNHAINYASRREPWAFGEPYLSMVRAIIDERYRLIPYIYSLFRRAALDGTPVLAPLAFHFPGDDDSFTVNDQFLLGPSMLVAPITTEGEATRWVYLPDGATWIDMRRDVSIEGGAWTLATHGIDQIPVFIRDGSIIPRAPVAPSTAFQPPDRRSLDVYCGAPASFVLYDDDGTSFDYEQGTFLETTLQCTPGSTPRIRIERTLGSWRSPAPRQWWVHVHRISTKPASVLLDEVALEFAVDETALGAIEQGWTYTSDGRIVVRLVDQDAPLTLTVQPES